MADEIVMRRYIFCAENDDTRHKGKRSAYLVEQLAGSNVVARIHPIGLVKEATARQEINLYAIKNNLTVTEQWTATESNNHFRTRVILGKDYE